jgi:hypothetical protein
VNGRRESVAATPGSYITLEREWREGDTVEVQFPMGLRMEAMPDDPTMIALLYGPIVLAGDLGTEGLTESERYGPSAPRIGRVRPVEVPVFVTTDVRDVLARVKPVAGAPMTFRTEGLGQPRDVTLAPFYKLHDRRYTVYWKVYSPAEWEKRKAEIAAREARRREIERLTIDAVNLNDPQSEQAHRLPGRECERGIFRGTAVARRTQRMVQLRAESHAGSARAPGLHLSGERRASARVRHLRRRGEDRDGTIGDSSD